MVRERIPASAAPASPRRRAASGSAASDRSLEAWGLRLGHKFHNPELLRQSLTHRSWTAAHAADADNERLELLGDAVLGLRVSERLLSAFPQAAEGELSRLRAWLVSARRLAEAARRIALGARLRLSPAEDRVGGREKDRLLANALEALIGAVHLDGGYAAAARFIDAHLLPDLEALTLGHVHEFVYKSLLQEWAHAHQLPPPCYQVISSGGPEHQKSFLVAVDLPGVYHGQASGGSKKIAEQAAARGALQALQALAGAGT